MLAARRWPKKPCLFNIKPRQWAQLPAREKAFFLKGVFGVNCSDKNLVKSDPLRGSDSSRENIGRLLPLVYDELRRLASSFLDGERIDHTLEPTALVHEAYLRLAGQRTLGGTDRADFFAAAATVMRRVLVDHARMKKAAKRGGGQPVSCLDEAVATFEQQAVDLVSLDEALNNLASFDDRKSRVVELKFFGGLTLQEVSDYLRVPLRTIERDWAMAKAWLRGELHSD